MAVQTRQASSLAEVVAAVRELHTTWNPTATAPQEIWYRGQAKRHYKLEPGLYRASSTAYRYDEFSLVSAFRNLSVPHVSARPEGGWEWHFLAQHYRVPTRLLDWTENLLVALYFALAEEMEKLDQAALRAARLSISGNAVFDTESPTIWLVDPGSLNNWSTGIDGVYAPPNRKIDQYQWENFVHSPATATNPIGIFAPRQNPRIHAQQGTFTIHGSSRDSIDTIAAISDPAGKIHIGCIELDRTRLADLWFELGLVGMSRLTIFPELDSVAEYVKFNYQDV